ncbi:MAG: SPOR domain-containing protein [Myxococcota bacterium]
MRDLDKLKHKIVIELDNRQVAVAILGFVLVSVGTFAAGVLVGQRAGDRLLEPVAGDLAAEEDDEAGRGESRTARLARIRPGTRAVDDELSSPSAQPSPSDPTEAARIETHRQMAAANATGAARSLGPIPVAAADEPAKKVGPFTLVDRTPDQERAALDGSAAPDSRYVLEVSSLKSEGPAEVVAGELRKKGHDARVRRITGEDDSTLWRVEIGTFEDMQTAGAFQREFERKAGYPTVMVPVR